MYLSPMIHGLNITAMRYSKQYNDFYSKFDFLMNLASVGVIKDIESLKKGILCAYEDVELSCKDGIMPDDVEGDGVMQCNTLSDSYDLDEPEDFTEWIGEFYDRWKEMADLIKIEFEEELAKLNAMKNEIIGLELKKDEEGNVSSLDRLRIYIKTILDLMDNVDSYDTCIELFKYAERIDVVKVMDAIRDVIAQNPRLSKILRKIVDNDEECYGKENYNSF